MARGVVAGKELTLTLAQSRTIRPVNDCFRFRLSERNAPDLDLAACTCRVFVGASRLNRY